MMICPETFYEECLKGKSEKEITKVIRSLKREIGRLKNIVEHPDYKTREVAMHPRLRLRYLTSRSLLKTVCYTVFYAADLLRFESYINKKLRRN